MRSRRVVWVELRQEWKAVWEEVTAWVACSVEAEQAWWTVVDVEACMMGMVVGVSTGSLLIQRGIESEFLDDIISGPKSFVAVLCV